MKKLTNSLGMAITIFLMLLANSCSKKDSIPGTGGGSGGVLLPSAPNSLSVKSADTALYFNLTIPNTGMAKVTLETDGQTISTTDPTAVVNGKTITFNNLIADRTVTITATNSNEAGNSSKSITFTVKCWSQKTSELNNYGKVKMTLNRVCVDGQQNLPNPNWIIYQPLSDTFMFKANGQSFMGTSTGKWVWVDSNETSINFGAGDVWLITLLPNGFKRTQIKNGYYTEQVFEKV